MYLVPFLAQTQTMAHQMLTQLTQSLQLFLHHQLFTFFTNLDPFRETPQTPTAFSPKLTQNPYLYYLLIFLSINYYGIFGLGTNFTIPSPNTTQILKTNTQIYLHQIFPAKAWNWSDTILLIANFTVLANYLNFLTHPWQIDAKFRIKPSSKNSKTFLIYKKTN